MTTFADETRIRIPDAERGDEHLSPIASLELGQTLLDTSSNIVANAEHQLGVLQTGLEALQQEPENGVILRSKLNRLGEKIAKVEANIIDQTAKKTVVDKQYDQFSDMAKDAEEEAKLSRAEKWDEEARMGGLSLHGVWFSHDHRQHKVSVEEMNAYLESPEVGRTIMTNIGRLDTRIEELEQSRNHHLGRAESTREISDAYAEKIAELVRDRDQYNGELAILITEIKAWQSKVTGRLGGSALKGDDVKLPEEDDITDIVDAETEEKPLVEPEFVDNISSPTSPVRISTGVFHQGSHFIVSREEDEVLPSGQSLALIFDTNSLGQPAMPAAGVLDLDLVARDRRWSEPGLRLGGSR